MSEQRFPKGWDVRRVKGSDILILEVIAEETMSPIAYSPMPSSLPAAE